MFETIDRQARKREAAGLIRTASVSAKGFTALYMALLILLNLIDSFSGSGILGSFVSILTSLLTTVLAAGFVFYCMAIRRGERAEYLTLFDGFSFAGKIICLEIVCYFFIFFWSLLFVIPGVIASYRYSFARYNLYENPNLGVMEALALSKRQTYGYKAQLLLLELSYLGWNLLSVLPTLVVSVMAVQRYDITSLTYGGMTVLPDPAAFLGLPFWAWVILQGLWSLAVALFFFPHYNCVKLSYFETAKATSGLGHNAPPPPNPWGSNGPDGLGGF